MNLKEQRAASFKAAQDIIEAAKADGGRDLTGDELQKVEGHIEEVKTFDEKLTEAAKAAQVHARFDQMAANADGPIDPNDGQQAKSLGEHFIKSVGADRLRNIQGQSGSHVSAPEFKAASDTQARGTVFNPVTTQVDTNIVQGYRVRPTIASLLGQGVLASGTSAVSYFVEGAREGNFTAVAEGATKPQLHYADPTPVTDTLKKIAGFVKFTDEMLTDLEFVKSEIDTRLLYDLSMVEEAQILSGSGAGANITGLLNRSGIQTVARGNAGSGDTIQDTIYRAMTAIGTATGLDPDGVAINPIDYQAMRLSKDGNQQYYGGGFLLGEYGVGSVQAGVIPIWGLRTIVTPAVAVGTALVANFQQAATLYRSGGVRVESTNSNQDDFINNLVTVRAEERIALAVRRPAAFVKTTISVAP